MTIQKRDREMQIDRTLLGTLYVRKFNTEYYTDPIMVLCLDHMLVG